MVGQPWAYMLPIEPVLRDIGQAFSFDGLVSVDVPSKTKLESLKKTTMSLQPRTRFSLMDSQPQIEKQPETHRALDVSKKIATDERSEFVPNIPSFNGDIANRVPLKTPPAVIVRREKNVILEKSLTTLNNNIDKNHTTTDVEKGKEKVPSEESDPNIVDWDPDDPLNPFNSSSWFKILNAALVSGICFVTPLASSMFAPGVPELMKEFKSTNVLLASFVVSVYVLGFTFGPLFFAPLSEIYGRLPIYHICNFGFLAFTIACALSTNLNMLIGFRFLEGVFGSAPLTNGGGTIADLFTPEKRGIPMTAFVMGPMIGPMSQYSLP
jgi:hypothetical protein